MIIFIIGIFVIIAGVIWAIAGARVLPAIGGALLGLILIAISFFTSVGTGHTGIVTTFGRVEDYTLDAGIHFNAPWHRVIEMDNRIQKLSIELDCFSSDIQDVMCTYTVNYQISKTNAQDIYRTIGKNYEDTAIVPNVQESVKTIIARYTAESLIANRDTLANEIQTLLTEVLVPYNIEVVSTSLENIEFKPEFTAAVEAKQIATQNKLKATTEQEQKTMEAEQAAERARIQAESDAAVAVINAQADLEVQKINADAAEYVGLKEAAKNQAIAESLTPVLIDYFRIMQWDGQYPTTLMNGTDTTVMMPIGE